RPRMPVDSSPDPPLRYQHIPPAAPPLDPSPQCQNTPAAPPPDPPPQHQNMPAASPPDPLSQHQHTAPAAQTDVPGGKGIGPTQYLAHPVEPSGETPDENLSATVQCKYLVLRNSSNCLT